MANGLELLRMLEPVTRPDGYGGKVQQPKQEALPIESRSFDSILEQVQLQAASLPTEDQQELALGTQQAPPVKPLESSGNNTSAHAGLMAGLDQIESVSLRQWIGSLKS